MNGVKKVTISLPEPMFNVVRDYADKKRNGNFSAGIQDFISLAVFLARGGDFNGPIH